MFTRIFISVVGLATTFSGLYLLMVTLWVRILEKPFEHRTTNIAFTISFIASSTLGGVSLILIGLSNRVWKTKEKKEKEGGK